MQLHAVLLLVLGCYLFCKNGWNNTVKKLLSSVLNLKYIITKINYLLPLYSLLQV